MLTSLSAVLAQAATPHRIYLPNVQVSQDQYAAHSEPSVAENPKNRLNLLAGSKMFTNPSKYEFKIGTYYTLDGGRTWHDNGFLPGFGGYSLTSDVSMAYSSTGVCYVAVLATEGKKSGVFVSRSTDGGATFSAPVKVFLDPSGQTFSDKPWITVDRSNTATAGTVYVAWNLDTGGERDPDQGPDDTMRPLSMATQTEPTGLVVARSTNGGQTFSAPVVVNPFNEREFPLGAIPQVAKNGVLSIVYANISNVSGRVNQLMLVQSSDGGVTFTAPRVIQQVEGLPNHLPNGTFRNLSLPSFVVSRRDGSMVVAWADERYGDSDILASTSADHGKTWSAPIRVNSDKTGNGKDQFQPEVAVAPNGTYTCAWFDRRHDSQNRLINEIMAQSTDDGRTFSSNVIVTDHAWDPITDAPKPDKNDTFIGDYQGLAVDNRTVHPLWNDTQNGVSQQIETVAASVQIFDRR